MALINKLTEIADAIREKTNTTNLLTLDEMPDAIISITGGGSGEGSGVNGYIPTDEELTISGIFQYKFAYGTFDWVINNYGDRIITKDLSNLMYGFQNCLNLTNIPFPLNCKATSASSYSSIFSGCKMLTNVPKMNNCNVNAIDSIFRDCNHLREIPEDIDENWDWSVIDSYTSAYAGNRSSTFMNCYSLRKFPMGFLNHGNPVVSYTYSIYNGLFNSCYALDEVVDLPLPHLNAEFTTNTFVNTFVYCHRLKEMTFATQEDGTPYSVKWKTQTIDLSKDVGYSLSENLIISYNSGITTDKEVKNQEDYERLKNDPDWYSRRSTGNLSSAPYSRYNHDSAVNTINSLPDASAYLASSPGTNTIKFKGDSGSLTDGGSINDLTEEEIAVAAAKGWTVTLV